MIDEKRPRFCDQCKEKHATFFLMIVKLYYCTDCLIKLLKKEVNK